MAAVVLRVVLLAGGLGLTEMAVTSLAAGDGAWLIQIVLGPLLLAAGTAGLIVPLLTRAPRGASSDD